MLLAGDCTGRELSAAFNDYARQMRGLRERGRGLAVIAFALLILVLALVSVAGGSHGAAVVALVATFVVFGGILWLRDSFY